MKVIKRVELELEWKGKVETRRGPRWIVSMQKNFSLPKQNAKP